MVKKVSVVLILLLCLTSCARYSETKLKEELDSYLENISERLNINTNSKLTHCSFYLPSDMVIDDCIDENLVLGYNDSRMIMNINVISIVNKHYYSNYKIADDGYFNKDNLVYSNSGSFLNEKEETINYFLNIYGGTPYYKIHLMTDNLNIYAYSLKQDCAETSKHMVLIARTVDVDKDMIISEYSEVDVISYQRKQIDLFQQKIPKSGLLTEMVKDE